MTVSELVVAETERAVARKVPRALVDFRGALRSTGLRLVPDPSDAEVAPQSDVAEDAAEVPIVVAARKAGVEYGVTLNRRHFPDNAGVAERPGLLAGAPGDALAWVRRRPAR